MFFLLAFLTSFIAPLTEQEEDGYWPQLIAIYEDFREYQARVEGVRKIQLYVLEPKRAA